MTQTGGGGGGARAIIELAILPSVYFHQATLGHGHSGMMSRHLHGDTHYCGFY